MNPITIINNITEIETTPLKAIGEINSTLFINNTGFNIMHVNIRSIIKHVTDLEFLNTALNNNNHIIITSESWISEHFNYNYPPFKNFQIVNTNSTIRKSDGGLVFIKN